jgi:type II secretory pathway component PulK
VKRAHPRPASERGVALLIVLMVLFIVAVLMVDITLTANTARRSARNASSEFLMDAAIENRCQVVIAQLRYDMAENKFDSPDDRMFRAEFSEYKAPVKETTGKDDDAVEAVKMVGDSDAVTVTHSNPDAPSPCEDEEAKFNLNLLMHPDAKVREVQRERLAVLIDRFREDTPLDISRTKADELRDRVVEYMERAAPGEGEKGKFPVAKSGPWRLLTPDELRYVDGFEDATHGLGAEGILYDAREPKAAQEYEADPDHAKKPEVYKGLLRYVTLWSGSAWVGQAAPESWLPININTASKPVLETLFYKSPGDFMFAQRIIDYRNSEKDDAATASKGKSGTEDPLKTHQYFEKVEDLKKVDGIDDAVIQRNGLTAAAVTVQSSTFSLDFLAKMDRAYKQVRYVVRRNNQGIQTLLREERADPRFDEDNENTENQ